ncbi:urea ABC transporter substrate-binding protein [Marinomonas transparens]|uniref:ABC transporter substrate-binding protein n=1 Tax=Marinomonas transparens TaxID=2795388 RepID=A0A934JLZ5_9GAMM|nr:ABC transporter substrate-binding protein [Marinomonas transparens]MBJ7536833.1 ABC transporter substrate-binding protein [Marinomonas transparens]
MKTYILKRIALSLMIFFAGSSYAQVKIGAIYDITGDLNIFGLQQINGLNLAVEDINAKGGVLGEKIKVVTYDTQSALNKYTQFAKTAVLRDGLDAIFAGLTSSSREAMRPIFRRANMPYFYSTIYEGGACDKQTFITGPTASQQLKPLIQWAIKKYGPKIYIMAPDYNFGTISASWINEYAKQFGGEVVGEDFLALTVTDYSPTIQKIQRSKPDFVVALPVGPSQVGFIEQFAAAGLKENTPIVSSNYSTGNEQVLLSPSAGKGIIASHVYFMSLNTPENKAFLTRWFDKYGKTDAISPEAVTVWNAVHLWAKAVEKAGTTDHTAVIKALESGDLHFTGPNGLVTMEAGSHHTRQNVYIAEGNDHYGFNIIKTFPNAAPNYESQVCDLIANPKLAKHFTPSTK